MCDKIEAIRMMNEAEEIWCVDTDGRKWIWDKKKGGYFRPGMTGRFAPFEGCQFFARTPDKKVWKASYLSGFYEYSHTEGEEMKETTTTLYSLEKEGASFWAIDKNGRKWIWKDGVFSLEHKDSGCRFSSPDESSSYYATTKDGRVWKSRMDSNSTYDLLSGTPLKVDEKKEMEPMPLPAIDSNSRLQVFSYGKELKVREFNFEFDVDTQIILGGHFQCHSLPLEGGIRTDTDPVKDVKDVVAVKVKEEDFAEDDGRGACRPMKEPNPLTLTGEQLKEKKATFWAVDEKGEKWVIPNDKYGDKYAIYYRERDHYACLPEGMDWGKTIFYARTPDDKLWIWDRTSCVYKHFPSDNPIALSLNKIKKGWERISEEKNQELKDKEPPVEALIGGYSDEREKLVEACDVIEKEGHKEAWRDPGFERFIQAMRSISPPNFSKEEPKPSKPGLLYRVLDFILP
jgi:hypothetical protein